MRNLNKYNFSRFNSFEQSVSEIYKNQVLEKRDILRYGAITHWLDVKIAMTIVDFKLTADQCIEFLNSLPFMRFEDDRYWMHENARRYILQTYTFTNKRNAIRTIDKLVYLMVGVLGEVPDIKLGRYKSYNGELLNELLFIGLVSSQRKFWLDTFVQAFFTIVRYGMFDFARQMLNLLDEAAHYQNSFLREWAVYFRAYLSSRGKRYEDPKPYLRTLLEDVNLEDQLRGYVLLTLGTEDRNPDLLLQGLEVARKNNDVWQEAFLLTNIASVYDYIANRKLARDYLYEAIEKSKISGDIIMEAANMMNLALEIMYDDKEESNTLFLRAYNLFVESSNYFAAVEVLMNYCGARLERREFLEAQAVGHDAVSLSEQLPIVSRRAMTYFNYALALVVNGSLQLGMLMYREGIRYLRNKGELLFAIGDIQKFLTNQIDEGIVAKIVDELEMYMQEYE